MSCDSYTSVIRMSSTQVLLYKYYESSQCTPKSKWSFLRLYAVRRFLQLFTKCDVGSTRQQTEQQYHKYNLKLIRQFLHNEKHYFLHDQSILIQALGLHVLGKVNTFHYGGMTAMLSHHAPTSPCSLRKNCLRKIDCSL